MKRLLLFVVFVLGVWTAWTALTPVQPGERAVIRRFGRILPDRPGPGLHVGLPWGIDVVERISIAGVRRITVGYRDETAEDKPTPDGQMLTGDHNLVNVQAEIHYTVREADVDRFAVLADRADILVSRTAETVLAEWIAGRKVDDVLLRGKALLPTTLVHEANRRLEPYGLGVRIEQASLTRLNPPDDVRAAFEEVAQAETAIRTRINEAEQSADSKLRNAEATRYRLARLAAAYGQAKRLEARADAEAFLERLRRYRELSKGRPEYLNILWLDETTRLFARLRQSGSIDLLDHHLSGDGLNITQFPLNRKKG
ncbi:MAG TPA: SPFH domain-containing protein [Gemmataceae bacterium]|jgi:membrane protease subunit HflK|nr:SPFH domain-containing protein [Gemmataceae bacterium]